ncbi:DUF4139 domain-containing protein [Pseudonocardia sp. CA-107938]|uniref:DUF4139 domain-containing protein n=1 Tax=Pseudonocardia sp. CA-107938 TaxID=3240021 RepID=UPI003D8A9E4E
MEQPVTLDAPIVAVTVHPSRARITRRGRVAVPAGIGEVVVADLPGELVEESVRVAARGAGIRVVGVDVRHRDLATVPDARVRAAEAALRDAERALAAVDAADAGAAARQELLTRLADRSGARLAAALADGTAQLSRISEIGESVAAEVAEVATLRRQHAEQRTEAQHAVDAARAELDRLRHSGRSRREIAVGIEAEAAGELELDAVYQVRQAGWSTAYDVRLTGADTVALTWYGMVWQASGEEWPACELTLSTARPAVSATVPELDPWWVAPQPPPQAVMRVAMPMAAGAAKDLAYTGAAMEAAPVPDDSEHAVAATWRLPRPTAVPGDGAPHRTTVTTAELPARLDHVVAPAVSTDAHLRATVTNTGGHVLLAGPASCFLDDAFVGTTAVEQTAPDGEFELALGVDDRVVVERELASRTAHKARFGANRASVEEWTTTVTNRRANPVRLVVRDRVPVTRSADVKIVDVALKPEPTERDDLGRVEWRTTVAPGAQWSATARFGVEAPRDLPLTGWR